MIEFYCKDSNSLLRPLGHPTQMEEMANLTLKLDGKEQFSFNVSLLGLILFRGWTS